MSLVVHCVEDRGLGKAISGPRMSLDISYLVLCSGREHLREGLFTGQRNIFQGF